MESTSKENMSEQLTPTAQEQKLNNLWDEDVRAEFEAHNTDETVAATVAKPLVNLVPVMIEGNKKEEAHNLYSKDHSVEDENGSPKARNVLFVRCLLRNKCQQMKGLAGKQCLLR
jgi:hypothetical protein